LRCFATCRIWRDDNQNLTAMPTSRATQNRRVKSAEGDVVAAMTPKFRPSVTIQGMPDPKLGGAAPILKKTDQNLVWLDCEMTGLDPAIDRIIEIAVIVTGPLLMPRIEGPVLVIHQSDGQLAKMDKWNQGTHGKSGLTDKVRASTLSAAAAQAQIIEFLAPFVKKGVSPLCGNSISQDRRFLVNEMPELEAFFHYRNIDVSTLKELAKRWRPDVYKSFKKKQRHTALADVHESIDELEHYRQHFLVAEASGAE
jgi:oligoribonuclease